MNNYTIKLNPKMQNDAYFKIAQDFWQRPLYLKCFLGSQPKRIFQSNLAKFVKSFAVYLLQLLNHNYHKKWLFSCIEHLLDSAVWWWLSVLYIVLLCSATVSAEPLLELLNMVASVIIHTDKTSSWHLCFQMANILSLFSPVQFT